MKGCSKSTVNFVASLCAYGISLSIGLAYTPFLVERLGVQAYGLIPLLFTLVQYFGFIAQTVGAAISQRLVAAVSDCEAYNTIYSTAVAMCACLSLVIIAAFILAALDLGALLNIPMGMEEETKRQFAAISVAFVLGLLTTPTRGTIFSQNAIYILSFHQALEAVVRVMIVVALFLLLAPSLLYVSIGIATASVIGSLFLVVAAQVLRPSLRFTLRVDPVVARSMMSTGGGIVLTQLGTLLLLNTDLIIMNIVYGPELGGTYAAVAQWALVLRGLALSVATMVTARIMQAYHTYSKEHLTELVSQSIRLLTSFACLPACFIACIAPSLLSVWLGPKFAYAAPILAVLAVSTAVNLVAIPLFAVTLAANKTYGVGLCHMVAGLSFMGAALCAAEFVPLGGVEIAIAAGLALVLKNWLYLIPSTGRLVGGATRAFTVASLLPLLWVTAATVLAHFISEAVRPDSYLELAGVGLLITPPYFALVALTIPREDKRLVAEEMRALFAMVKP